MGVSCRFQYTSFDQILIIVEDSLVSLRLNYVLLAMEVN